MGGPDGRLEKARARLAARRSALEQRGRGAMAGAVGQSPSPAPLPVSSPPVQPPRWPMGWPAAVVLLVALLAMVFMALRDGTEGEVRAIQAELATALSADLGLPAGTLRDYPLMLCLTPESYAEALLQDVPLREDARAILMSGIRDGAAGEISGPLLSSVGVNIPGRGAYLNGWQISRANEAGEVSVLAHPGARVLLLMTAAHEQWGHGFISELTPLGQEKKRVQLGRIGVASQFELSVIDTPESARLTRQWAALFLSTHYVEEGFATWVESRLPALALSPENRVEPGGEFWAQHTAEGVIEALGAVPEGRALAEAIDQLFNGPRLDFAQVHEAMGKVVDLAGRQEGLFYSLFELAPPYVLGGAMAHRIAENAGHRMVPVAVMMACSVTYNLAEVSVVDLEHRIESDPASNVNTRFAALMQVRPSVRDDVEEFHRSARERWGDDPWRR